MSLVWKDVPARIGKSYADTGGHGRYFIRERIDGSCSLSLNAEPLGTFSTIAEAKERAERGLIALLRAAEEMP